MLKGPRAQRFEGVESCGILKFQGFCFSPKQVHLWGSILKKTEHAGAGLGAHRCLCVYDHVCLHAVSVCLNIIAFHRVGRVLRLCVSACLIMYVFMMCLCPFVIDHVCLHDVSVCLSMSAFGGGGWALCLCVFDHVCLHDSLRKNMLLMVVAWIGVYAAIIIVLILQFVGFCWQ